MSLEEEKRFLKWFVAGVLFGIPLYRLIIRPLILVLMPELISP